MILLYFFFFKEGVELSSDLIRKAVKDFAPTQLKLKEEYFSQITKNVTTQHVKLSIPGPTASLHLWQRSILCCPPSRHSYARGHRGH